MTANERIDARLSELMHDLAGSADEPLTEVLLRTAQTRQRPGWTFPERWLPMTEITARMSPQASRPLLVALLLLLLAMAFVIASGFWPRTVPPLPAQVDIDGAAAQRFEVSGAGYPAVGLERLWVTVGGAGVAEVDPASGEIVRVTQIDGGGCGRIEVAFDRVWAPTCQVGGISAIGRDGSQTAIPFGIPVPLAEEEVTIGLDDDALWMVAGGLGDQLLKIDPQAMQVTARFPIAQGSANAEVGFGSVWLVSKNTGEVTRVDPATGRIQATIGVGSLPRFLAAGESAVWVVNQEGGTVSRIDPRLNAVVATIVVGPLPAAGQIEVVGGSVWIRGIDNVLRIDPSENRVVKIYGPAPGLGAIGPDGDSLWVTSPDANLVWRLLAD